MRDIMLPSEDQRAFAKFAAAAEACEDVEALVRPFSRRLDVLLEGAPVAPRKAKAYERVAPGVYLGFRQTSESASPVRIETAALPDDLAERYGHRALLRLERQKDVAANWLTLEIEEEPALAGCFERIEVLLRGRAAPRPLNFHVGIIANYASEHQVVGRMKARFQRLPSSVLAEFRLGQALKQAAAEVTALKLAVFLPVADLERLELFGIQCIGHFADA
jgi:hypothetical protein